MKLLVFVALVGLCSIVAVALSAPQGIAPYPFPPQPVNFIGPVPRVCCGMNENWTSATPPGPYTTLNTFTTVDNNSWQVVISPPSLSAQVTLSGGFVNFLEPNPQPPFRSILVASQCGEVSDVVIKTKWNHIGTATHPNNSVIILARCASTGQPNCYLAFLDGSPWQTGCVAALGVSRIDSGWITWTAVGQVSTGYSPTSSLELRLRVENDASGLPVVTARVYDSAGVFLKVVSRTDTSPLPFLSGGVGVTASNNTALNMGIDPIDVSMDSLEIDCL